MEYRPEIVPQKGFIGWLMKHQRASVNVGKALLKGFG